MEASEKKASELNTSVLQR